MHIQKYKVEYWKKLDAGNLGSLQKFWEAIKTFESQK